MAASYKPSPDGHCFPIPSLTCLQAMFLFSLSACVNEGGSPASWPSEDCLAPKGNPVPAFIRKSAAEMWDFVTSKPRVLKPPARGTAPSFSNVIP